MHISELGTGYRESNWKFIPDTAPPATRKSVIPTETQPDFGAVTTPASSFDTDDLWIATRDEVHGYLPVSQQQCSDTFFATRNDLPVEDYSSNPSNLFTDDPNPYAKEWDGLADYYAAEVASMDAAERWTDAEPNYCTHAVSRWIRKVQPGTGYYRHIVEYREPKTSVTVTENGYERLLSESDAALATDKVRNVDSKDAAKAHSAHNDDTGTALTTYVDGYTVRRLVDFDVTERFQNMIFNVYRGNDGNLHVGLITLLDSNEDGLIAICKHRACRRPDGKHNSFRYTGDGSRLSMEDFVVRIIRHGNNHGPDWRTARDDFAYFHAENCDTSEHVIRYELIKFKNRGLWEWGYAPIATPCNSNKPTLFDAMLDPENASDCYQFLKQHQKFCNDLACKCDHYESLLWDTIYGSALTTTEAQ